MLAHSSGERALFQIPCQVSIDLFFDHKICQSLDHDVALHAEFDHFLAGEDAWRAHRR